MVGYYFFQIIFSDNCVCAITNKCDWGGFQEVDLTGGGFLDIASNNFTHFPNISELGFKSESN